MDTVVVRLWAPAEAAGDPRDARPGIHGTAHHVGSGRIATFRNGQELLALLDDLRGGLTEPGEPDPRPVQAIDVHTERS